MEHGNSVVRRRVIECTRGIAVAPKMELLSGDATIKNSAIMERKKHIFQDTCTIYDLLSQRMLGYSGRHAQRYPVGFCYLDVERRNN